ncbi:hypothetical protein UFOVP760_97 [uncultured Caudovirales phage]|uniref:Uncharacterized protein n=1 Tax=uncultured Caudovirales phage TaxID=2100421 RepID=A0A6J7X627_9CAUD|nr:hypothetical protein UFOVP760_97 [uncultured Caudovirales phage]
MLLVTGIHLKKGLNIIVPDVDRNIIKWSGFFENADTAQAHLDREKTKYSMTKKIVSAKKEFVDTQKHNKYLFRFTVVLS